MQIDLISQHYYENYPAFKNTTVKRQWDILFLVVDGEFSIFAKEIGKNLVLKKNDIVFIPAGTEMERKILSPLTWYQVAFLPQTDHPFYLSASFGKLILPQEQTTAIFEMTERAFMLPDNRALITHVVSHVFAENYLFGKGKKVKFKPLSTEVKEAVQYMRKNFARKIDMDELAERVFLSHSGLIWKFKHELNTTPSKYLNILRLRYAKQLLLNYPYSITEISEQCGFSNPYYFTNTFHHAFGLSPSAFRDYYLKE